MPTLGQISTAFEGQVFTGRARELATFRNWLAQEELPTILTVSGPGGVGKSALLRRYARIADEMGRRVLTVDGNTFAPTQSGLLTALAGTQTKDVLGHLSRTGPLILIDSFEKLVDLSQYFYGEFLPGLSATVRVVVAGRALPAPWSTNSHWHKLILPIPLAGFSQAESREYLDRLGVREPDLVAQILDAVGGHPLALSLAAEHVLRLGVRDLNAVQEWHLTVRSLVEYVLRDVSDPQLRALVDTCAVVRQFDEAMLSAIGGHELGPVFDDLCGLSVVEPAKQGLTIHSAVRRLLIQDLRWRGRARYSSQRALALSHIKEQTLSANGAEYEHLTTERLFLGTNQSVKELLFAEEYQEYLLLEPGRPADLGDLARIWSCYLENGAPGQPTIDYGVERDFLAAVLNYSDARVRVARNRDGDAVGFSTIVPICHESLALVGQHPGFANLLRTHAPAQEMVLHRPNTAVREVAYLLHLGYADMPPGEVRAALLRDVVGLFAAGGTYLCCTAVPSLQIALKALGFTRVDGGETRFWGEANVAVGFRLTIPRGGLESWLASLSGGESPRRSPAASVDADVLLNLTQRERDVLSLLIRGWVTNRQIAAELCITPGTANLHVKRILSKLGVASRAEVLARATRDGLVGRLAPGEPRRSDSPPVDLLRAPASLDWAVYPTPEGPSMYPRHKRQISHLGDARALD